MTCLNPPPFPPFFIEFASPMSNTCRRPCMLVNRKWSKRLFEIVKVFFTSIIDFLFEKVVALQLNLLTAVLCAKFSRNCSSISGKQDFKSRRYIFIISLPFEKGMALHFNNPKSTPPNMIFVPSLVDICSMVLESNIYYVLSLSWLALLRKKEVALPLNKLEFPSFNDALCHDRLKFGQWFWRREEHMKKKWD